MCGLTALHLRFTLHRVADSALKIDSCALQASETAQPSASHNASPMQGKLATEEECEHACDGVKALHFNQPSPGRELCHTAAMPNWALTPFGPEQRSMFSMQKSPTFQPHHTFVYPLQHIPNEFSQASSRQSSSFAEPLFLQGHGGYWGSSPSEQRPEYDNTFSQDSELCHTATGKLAYN